jgi:hypothetical protein
LATEPNGASAFQVADHDAVLVPFGNGDLVNANDVRSRGSNPAQLFAHVLFVQLLDGVPIEEELLRYFLDWSLTTTSAHEKGEPLGVKGIVGQPVQRFGFHAATPGTQDSAHGEDEVNVFIATGEITDASRPLVVVAAIHRATDATNRFFRRRCKAISTALGSPKIPRTLGRGTKPGNRYRSWSRLNLAIAKS